MTRFKGLGSNRITGHAVTMLMLANLVLRGSVGRVVLDRTGLSGAFDLDLEWTRCFSIFTAVREQLGPRLDSQRGPVDVLVIDHVERPTED